jgi:hypothetical protein
MHAKRLNGNVGINASSPGKWMVQTLLVGWDSVPTGSRRSRNLQASGHYRWLQAPGQWLYTWAMSTLAEVEAVVSRFSPAELAELEQFVRQTRIEKTRGDGRSALDLPPLDLGRMLQPLGDREQWYDEMLEDRV